ncbi:MAG: histidine phosphatase family protein [Planctomycetota bacterium]
MHAHIHSPIVRAKRAVGFILAAILMVVAGCTTTPSALDSTTTVILVCHAERADASRDSALSPPGHARAQDLAAYLLPIHLDAIHSTDYRRTRDTAQPTANARGLEIELYDPRQLDALAAAVIAAGGTHLVVGHSNTTPDAVAAFGGDPGAPIDDATEFDRLYVLTIDANGHVMTAIRRFGAPSP